jgi:hypothetical protein
MRLDYEEVVFRDYPLGPWLIGVIAIAAATVVEITLKAWDVLLFALVGVLVIAFASILTVTVDRKRGTLNLHYSRLRKFVSIGIFPNPPRPGPLTHAGDFLGHFCQGLA